ncbi:hypothetical protein L3X38_025900 [Prunus dulcis]|uniref:Uncharacterized protein n=1 Tax=Prunus dulcis TaxID=3755 RepID=A0AAD4Z7U5_PRUDU|nr:hypothetical protein L3X38_025900 [Prunus dulcis]
MASKKIQTVPATRDKSVNASFSSEDSAGVVTQSKGKAITAIQHVTSIPTQAKAKDMNRRHEPNSRERSLSPVSDADSNTGSYHGSPSDDQPKKIASVSIGKSYSMDMQVMVTEAMSIEEQLAHISEAIMKLTKMVEEKDAQIASFINK